MKDDVIEPQRWRETSRTGPNLPSLRRRPKPHYHAPLQNRLPLEALDAAFDEVAEFEQPADALESLEKPDPMEIINGISAQLKLLESQKVQLQRLLSRAQFQR